jgi:Domain of unknown function (DUF4418)
MPGDPAGWRHVTTRGGTDVRVLAGVVVAMALAIGIVPQFTNCEARGGTMPDSAAASGAGSGAGTMMGSAPPAAVVRPKMRCLWTARAEIGVAVPLFAAGGLILFSRRRETRRALAVPSALLGIVAVLLPTALIGVCASRGAVCRTSLLPSMLVAGGLTVAASLAIMVLGGLRPYASAAAHRAG